MDAGYLHGEQLLRLKQMVQVGFRVDAIYLTAVGVDGREVVFPLFVAHVHRALVGKQHGVAPVSGRHHAVEHVYTTLDSFENVLRCTNAHEVTGLIFGQYLVYNLYHLIHHLGWFANCQPADSVSIGTFIGYMLGRLLSKVFVSTTLYNGKEALLIAIKWLRFVKTFETAIQPTLC